ncbi:MAG: hypothetical protein EXS64_18160 [Candidatus Latescibacteria bacterium]|nr:hypothetical protein [Candidatus Latescibacterota bacterium]
MIPLVSSNCYGPLGVCQLPRTWWKVLLRKKGLLDEEYPDCGDGLDAGVLRALGLDQEAALDHLRTTLPTYLDFEAWVLRQKGGSLDGEAVSNWNFAVRSRVHNSPAKIEETYRDIGFGPDVRINSAGILNSLQDWQLFHKRDLNTGFPGLGGKVVPVIATIDYGPLGVCQLPRTWQKILLRAKGLLHPDYPDMTKTGLDPKVLAVLRLDVEAVLKYIRENLPDYLRFEGWVLEQTKGRIDRDAVEAWNTFLRQRVHLDAKRTDIHATVGRKDDGTLTSAVVLNHIEDWHLAHATLVK